MRNEMPPLPGEEMPGKELPEMGTNEICFPKSALAVSAEAEGGEDSLPEDGEDVTVEVTGKIRIKGDKAYLTPATANGEPVEKAAGAAGVDDEGSELEAMGEKLDSES
jgi:hypothetical protein